MPRTGLLPIFIPMQAELDAPICRRLLTRAPAGSLLLDHLTASELCGLLPRLKLAVGMRLHMLIYATHMHTPAIGISYDPKVDAFLAYAGQPAPIKPDHPFAEELTALVESVCANPNTAVLAARDAELASLAQQNAILAVELSQKRKKARGNAPRTRA